jgi:putative membrane protein
MSAILTSEEQERLAQLIGQVERTTAGEIVAVVLHKSASYGSYRIATAALLALLGTSAGHLTWPWLSAMELLGAQALLGILLYWLLGWPALLRCITPRAVQRRAVSDRVKLLFIERGVTETRDRSGVLILLSALERRVEILGDRGIHEHLGDDTWRSMVSELTHAIGNGKAADGLAKIIERLGSELSAKFPARPDDTNELPNRIVTDD